MWGDYRAQFIEATSKLIDLLLDKLEFDDSLTTRITVTILIISSITLILIFLNAVVLKRYG